MPRPTRFVVGYSDIARLTNLPAAQLRSEFAALPGEPLRKAFEFLALHGKSDLKLDIVLYACAREKTQVSSWRKDAMPRRQRRSPLLDEAFSFDYDDLVKLTGLERNAIYQHKTRKVFNPNDLRSVLVELVARFSEEELKVGLVIRACQNTDFHDFLKASQRRLAAS